MHDLHGTAHYLSDTDHPHRWIVVTHVCKRWRDIAVNCPSLWTRVIVGRAERVDAFLNRAKDCTLTLEAFERTFNSSKASSMEIFTVQHAQRLKALRGVSLAFLAPESRTGLIHFPTALQMPCIETLDVKYLNRRGHKGAMYQNYGVAYHYPGHGTDLAAHLWYDPHVFPMYTNAFMPRLGALFSDFLPFPLMKSLTRPTLTGLHISRMHASFPEVDEWLRLLQDLPLLEHLELNNAITPLALDEFSGSVALRYPVISLPGLKDVTISQPGACPAAAAFLLLHITSSPETSICIKPGDIRYYAGKTGQGATRARVRFVLECLAHRLSRAQNLDMTTDVGSSVEPYQTAALKIEVIEVDFNEVYMDPLSTITASGYKDYLRTLDGRKEALLFSFVGEYEHGDTGGGKILNQLFASGIFSGVRSIFVAPEPKGYYQSDFDAPVDKPHTWMNFAHTRVGHRLTHVGLWDEPGLLGAFADVLQRQLGRRADEPTFGELESLSIVPHIGDVTSSVPDWRRRNGQIDLREALEERRAKGLGPKLVDIGEGLLSVEDLLSSTHYGRGKKAIGQWGAAEWDER
ncbi:F-box protein [Phanerochaete sordida]|uniref:F-box protein n=1 Tax=Phanerochaete sordida TaxID=48140 RepID=A0A9P3G6H5_9APHY|nr:F-box protein [Phanerochaete sordida]